MNTWTPYIVGSACILKGGDRADNRMRELNELIASAKRTASDGSIAIPKRREPANRPNGGYSITRH